MRVPGQTALKGLPAPMLPRDHSGSVGRDAGSLACLQARQLPAPALPAGLWVPEGSALPAPELSNSQGPCWHSRCNMGIEGWAVLGSTRSLCGLGQAGQSLRFLPVSGIANASLCSRVFTRLIN